MNNLDITELSADLNVISSLGDVPNVDNNLTPAQLKAKFDQSGNSIKTYINDTLIPEIEEQVNEEMIPNLATKAEIQGITLGQIPDGTLTSDKFESELQEGIELSKYNFKYVDLTLDNETSTRVDMTMPTLDDDDLTDGLKILVKTPSFSTQNSSRNFYINNILIDSKINGNTEYELVYDYTINRFRKSSFINEIIENIAPQCFTISESQSSINKQGRLLWGLWRSDYAYKFQLMDFTYNAATNTTTIQNPCMDRYGEGGYAFGFGFFAK